ncbi:hypothetical protein BCR37DRAFT_390254 [Protomyces lactucae-debilis]|uniref:Uncharacterized protein n=1 Tax=Protomyces lactucae-debilis TaxID=2754530 RepID=A0A1Y2FWQ0_PROLT|nr:uncharacterized protein BCR37DRAFT_390254 [Protomyces lactucae-debilis]ORY87724.1 hypothetical protein BCR37DRAFT_390254 [Protomyces lactucae-debilis]
MSRTQILHQARNGVRVVLYTLLGTGTTAALGFGGMHLFLEKQEPTPSSWPAKARFAYRAAVFNQRFMDQPEAAREDLRIVLAQLQEAGSSNEATQEVCLANVYVMLGDTARKQGNLPEALEDYVSALAAVPVNNKTTALRASCARKLGEIQERLGQHAEAAVALDLAVQCFFPEHRPGMPIKVQATVRHEPEMLNSVKALALLRAKQGKLRDALNTLMSVLQYEEVHPQITIHSCQTASTMSNISELVWALGSTVECEKWAKRSLNICLEPQNRHDDYCGECAANNYNTLGLLARRAGNMPQARQEFSKALLAAERSKYETGLYEFGANLESCQKM